MSNTMNHLNTQSEDSLVDNFGRTIRYLRISVTDRCDFRCIYCMDEEMTFLPRSQLLTFAELTLIARAFVELGVNKIRITGGEPLVRKNVTTLFDNIGKLPGLDELVTTTNGSQLVKFASPLKKAGVTRINISLDTLNAEKFKRITRSGKLDKVLAGIQAAIDSNFERIKLNTVILKHRNDDEIIDLVKFAIEKNIDISFIEEMPLGVISEHNRATTYYSSDQIRTEIEKHMPLIATDESTGGPSKYYRIPDVQTRIGFISPHSHNFCAQCNRVRLTCEGRLLLCLGQENSVDLREVVRSGSRNDIEKLKKAIRQAIDIKPKSHDFQLQAQPVIFRHMNVTGG